MTLDPDSLLSLSSHSCPKAENERTNVKRVRIALKQDARVCRRDLEERNEGRARMQLGHVGAHLRVRIEVRRVDLRTSTHTTYTKRRDTHITAWCGVKW
jgi:hypothetical protein